MSSPSKPHDRAPSAEVTVIDRQAQVRALSNPERRRILDLLIERSGTASQVARWIDGTRGRVHYHIKQLEQAGLVEVVSRQERGGATEKYYRANARNFYVAVGIGEHAALSDDVRSTISSSMLSWRRERMLDLDVRDIARRVLEDGLSVSAGSVVLLVADPSQRELVELFHAAITDLSAHCLVYHRGLTPPDFLLRWASDLGAAIFIEEPLDRLAGDSAIPSKADADLTDDDLEHLARRALAFGHAAAPTNKPLDAIMQRLCRDGVRTIYFGYPSPQRAERLGIDFRKLHDACWKALSIDYTALAEECATMGTRLGRTREVHLRAPGGTDLRFHIDGRDVFIDDGVISDWEVENGRGFNHLPAGKVLVAARRGTAQGTLHSRVTDFLGVRIEGIRLVFRDGVVVSATADRNEALLRRILDSGSGDHLHLGAFEIGMNPAIRDTIGYGVWDGKGLGNVLIGIGDNSGINGDNRSDFAWAFHVERPRISLDGDVVAENGALYPSETPPERKDQT